MEDLNLALLAKLGWQFCTNNDCLWVQMLKVKYCKLQHFFEVQSSSTDSWLWKRILKSKELLSKGMCMIVGDGTNIDIWKDPWVPFIPGFRPFPGGDHGLGSNLVSDLIIKPAWVWNSAKLHSFFYPLQVDGILKIQISPNQSLDRWAWIHNSNGVFSVKSAYLKDQEARFSYDGPLPKNVWKVLWNSHLHERYKVLIWKLCWDILPVRGVICRRFHIVDTSCPFCGANVESAKHLFMECKFSKLLWMGSRWSLRMDAFSHLSLMDWLYIIPINGSGLHLAKDDALHFLHFAAVLMDMVWFSRNKLVFDKVDTDPKELLLTIERLSLEHLKAKNGVSRPPDLHPLST
ncbi:hypothetical protein L1049_023557 [Liquidambar formosana]|uniref:Reverse transcriptase zinc-binding domain-containing protein n=1 Tax=Liquidambar formosana TaxID=63359 RepID=A0AAP0RYD2_LIQFO